MGPTPPQLCSLKLVPLTVVVTSDQLQLHILHSLETDFQMTASEYQINNSKQLLLHYITTQEQMQKAN